MSGADAAKTTGTEYSETGDGKDVSVNSGKRDEPSMDEILASIRKIISDQTKEADQAAVEAADSVANPQQISEKVDTIIGQVALDHWTADEVKINRDNEPAVNTDVETPQTSLPIKAAVQKPDAVTGSVPESARDSNQTASLEDLIKPASRTVSAQDTSASIVDRKKDAANEPLQELRSDSWFHSSAAAGPASQKPVEFAPAKPASVEPYNKPAVGYPPIKQQSPKKGMVVDTEDDSALERLIARQSDSNNSGSHAKLTSAPEIANGSLEEALEAELSGQLEGAILALPENTNASATIKTDPPATSQFEDSLEAAINPPPVMPAPLLSANVNSSVSDKFEHLALATLEGRKDEMDTMMINIMRPMLRNWLEDNLPSLVERLVREEIERVSRGTHS